MGSWIGLSVIGEEEGARDGEDVAGAFVRVLATGLAVGR